MASFDENGKYIKTNWKAGDKITATKLNKIEESIEAVNDNDISRHVEADARLDALEAKDVAHDKELTNIKNTIADNKAAAELGDYDINSRMTFLENELNEGIEEVYNVAETVDGKIATAEANMAAQVETAKDEMTAQVETAQANMTAQVDQGKADMEAMVAEVESEMNELQNDVSEIQNDISEIQNDVLENQNDIDGLQNDVSEIQNNVLEIQNDVNTRMSWETDIGQDSAASSNYYILPGGLMIQYGRVTFEANTLDTTHDFSLELPKPCNVFNSVFICSLSGADNGWDGICSGHFTSPSYVRIVMRNINNTVINTVYWTAIAATNENTINEEIID